MSRNALYTVIGILVIAVVALGDYHDSEVNGDAQLTIGADETGISVEVDE